METLIQLLDFIRPYGNFGLTIIFAILIVFFNLRAIAHAPAAMGPRRLKPNPRKGCHGQRPGHGAEPVPWPRPAKPAAPLRSPRCVGRPQAPPPTRILIPGQSHCVR